MSVAKSLLTAFSLRTDTEWSQTVLADVLQEADELGDALDEDYPLTYAAFDAAIICWALTFSRRPSIFWKARIEGLLRRLHFRPSPLWRGPRHALRDLDDGRAIYLYARSHYT